MKTIEDYAIHWLNHTTKITEAISPEAQNKFATICKNYQVDSTNTDVVNQIKQALNKKIASFKNNPGALDDPNFKKNLTLENMDQELTKAAQQPVQQQNAQQQTQQQTQSQPVTQQTAQQATENQTNTQQANTGTQTAPNSQSNTEVTQDEMTQITRILGPNIKPEMAKQLKSIFTK